MLVSDAVAAVLAEYGADTVFGVVGSGNFHVTNALIARGARFVPARHEGRRAGPRGTGPGRPGGTARDGAPAGAAAGGTRSAGRAAHSGGAAPQSASGASR